MEPEASVASELGNSERADLGHWIAEAILAELLVGQCSSWFVH